MKKCILKICMVPVLLFSCRAEVKKIVYPPYEIMIAKGEYAKAVRSICAEINSKDSINEFVSWLEEVREALLNDPFRDEILKNYAGDIESMEDQEFEIQEVNDSIEKFYGLLKKELKKSIQDIAGSSDEIQIREKISAYKKDISDLNYKIGSLRSEINELKYRVEDIEKEINEIEARIKFIDNKLETPNLHPDSKKELLEIRKKYCSESDRQEDRVKNIKKQIVRKRNRLNKHKKEKGEIKRNLRRYSIEKNIIPDPEKVREFRSDIKKKKDDRLDLFSKFLFNLIVVSIKEDEEIDYKNYIFTYLKPESIKSLRIP